MSLILIFPPPPPLLGTFGQEEPWEIFTPASWKHPMVPFEILTDPQSMPHHPVLGGETSVWQIISSDQNDAARENSLSKVCV